jgi:hypothetical protein
VTANNADTPVFRGPLAKRMSAEQFVDAVWTITGTAPANANKAVPRGKPGESSSLSARWIWSDANASASMPDDHTVTLGTEVTLPTAPLSARAVFIADNEAEIFINGRSIVHETIQPAGPRGIAIDLKDLRAGKNSIIVVARNGGSGPNPAGFLLEGRIELPDGRPITIATGPSWKWTSAVPDAKGHFARPPQDWQPAQVLANPGVWDRFVAAMPPLTADPVPMVRASLVPADLLMRGLGRPNREQIVSMRPDNITTLEAIDLANGEQLAGLLKKGATSLASARKPTPELIDQVFLRALGRRATAAEKNGLGSALGSQPTPQAIEDLLWMVILLPEFQFVR